MIQAQWLMMPMETDLVWCVVNRWLEIRLHTQAYTGRYFHPEIGLLYYRARYYDPETGEFISRDPLEYVDGISFYRGYFIPRGVDPSGQFVIVTGVIVTTVWGATVFTTGVAVETQTGPVIKLVVEIYSPQDLPVAPPPKPIETCESKGWPTCRSDTFKASSADLAGRSCNPGVVTYPDGKATEDKDNPNLPLTSDGFLPGSVKHTTCKDSADGRPVEATISGKCCTMVNGKPKLEKRFKCAPHRFNCDDGDGWEDAFNEYYGL